MRWLKWVVIAVVTVALLAGVAEFVLRQVIPSSVAGEVRTELQLDEAHPVEVDLGGSALWYALQGGVGDITVEVPDVPLLGDLRIDASAHAEFVPFNPEHGEIRGATASLSAQPDQLDALIAVATQGFAETGQARGGDIVVGRTLEFFGQSVPVTATFGIEVTDGDLVIEPKGIDAAGFDLDIDSLSSMSPGLLEPVVGAHTVCVRDQLPAGITLTRLEIASDGSVRIDAAVDPSILSDERQLDPGTCD